MKNDTVPIKWQSLPYDIDEQEHCNTQPLPSGTEEQRANMHLLNNDQHFSDSRAVRQIYRLDTDQIVRIFQTMVNDVQNSEDSESIKYMRTVPPSIRSEVSVSRSEPCKQQDQLEFRNADTAVRAVQMEDPPTMVEQSFEGRLIELNKFTLEQCQNVETSRQQLSKFLLVLDKHPSSDLYVRPIIYYNSQEIWCYMQKATSALKLYDDGQIAVRKLERDINKQKVSLENVFFCHRTRKFCTFEYKEAADQEIYEQLNVMKRSPESNIDIDDRRLYEQYKVNLGSILLQGFITYNIRPKQLYFVGSGNFGRIYIDWNQSTVVKRVSYGPTMSSFNCKIETINELYLLNLCQDLISPKPDSMNIVETPNYLQFRMEKCIPITMLRLSPQKIQKLFDQFLKNIDAMHNMGIFHRDIKPQNILYSQRLKRLVLIDFGMGTLTTEICSNTHFTMFCGTMNYMSEEMKQLEADREGYINLRQNDRYAAEKAIKQMRQKCEVEEPVQNHLDFLLSKLNLKPNITHNRHLFSVLSKLSLRDLSLNIIQNLTTINNSRLFFDILHFLSEDISSISIPYLKSLLANPLTQEQQEYLEILEQQYEILSKQQGLEAYLQNTTIPKIRKDWLVDRILQKYHHEWLFHGKEIQKVKEIIEKCQNPMIQLAYRIEQIHKFHGSTNKTELKNDVLKITKINQDLWPFTSSSANHIANWQQFIHKFVKSAIETAIENELALLKLLDYMFLQDNFLEQQPNNHQLFNFQRQKCVILSNVPSYSFPPSEVIRTRNIVLIDFNPKECYPTVFQATIGNIYLHIHYSFIKTQIKQQQIDIFFKGKNMPIKIKIQKIEEFQHFCRNFVAQLALSELRCGPRIVKLLGNDFIICNGNAIYLEEDIEPIADFNGLADVVKKLHQNHIVVRNINPDAIWRSKHDGRLVITDVRYVRGIESDTELTEMCGNPKYMGREMKKLLDERTIVESINLVSNDLQAVEKVQLEKIEMPVVQEEISADNHITFIISFLCSIQQGQSLFVFKTLQRYINLRKSLLFAKSINKNYRWQEQITTLQSKNMYSFQECHLRYNFLEDIFVNSLTGMLDNIVKMDLSHNCLTQIAISTLESIKFPYLTHLLLFDNQIGSAAWRIFNFEIPSIHTINIGDNEIVNSPEKTKNCSIKMLSISHNDIKYDKNFQNFLNNLQKITYLNITRTMINPKEVVWKQITVDFVDSGEETPKNK